MERRKFISRNLAIGALAPADYASLGFTDPKTGARASSVENDEAVGRGAINGERFLNNEKDNEEVARVLGRALSLHWTYSI